MDSIFSQETAALTFLSGGGKMGEQIRTFDWAATSLGNPRNWPQSLKTCVRIILTSSQPMFVWWGREKINIYNDPYAYILGDKHPSALGRSGYDVWHEIWEWIGPRADHVLNENEGTYDEALMLIMNRYGYDEETYFKFSYNPVPGDDGTTQGLFCACTEETQRILDERHLKTLRALAKILAPVKDGAGVNQYTLETLALNRQDFPFAFMYMQNQDGLARTLATENDKYFDGSMLSVNWIDNTKVIDDAAIAANETKTIQVVPLIPGEAGYGPNSSAQKSPGTLLVIPIVVNETDERYGLLVVGCNPYRPIDEKYLHFFSLVADQVGASVLSVRAYEKELKNKEALKESEELFRTMAEGTDILITVGDEYGKTNYFNSEWTKVTGRTMDELIEIGWTDLVNPQEREVVKKVILTAVEAKIPYNMEFQMSNKDGEYIWLLGKGTARFHSDGSFAGYISSLIDITARKQVEEAIRESELRFRNLADQSPMMVFIIEANPEPSISYWNKTWLDYTGQTVEEALGRAWNGIVHPEDVSIVFDAFLPAYNNREPYFIPAVRLKRYDNVYRWHAFKGNPRYAPNGSFNGYVGVGLDVDEQKRTEERLEALVDERTKELLRSNEDLQQFAHVASHDLKEPVRKIKTFSERLIKEFGDELPDKAKSYLWKMERASNRVVAMIEGVLLYSTLDAELIYAENIDLNKIIGDIESDLEVLIASKNAIIKYDQLPSMEGSLILIYQLFYNLINNSLKFSKTDRSPIIEIRQEKVDEIELRNNGIVPADQIKYIMIVVSDNGIGFTDEDATRIFTTFLRLHSKDLYEGTGLGLSLCKKIVERHGGAIYAVGTENEGAVFKIILPLKQSDKS